MLETLIGQLTLPLLQTGTPHLNTTGYSNLLRTSLSLNISNLLPILASSGKSLDLLFSSYPTVISNINLVSGMSDHLAVLFNINIKATKSPKPPHKVYIYKRANFDGLNGSMLHSSEEFFASNRENYSIEENWSLFKCTLAKAINEYIPQRSSCSKYKLPWVNPRIKHHMRRKDRSHKKSSTHSQT